MENRIPSVVAPASDEVVAPPRRQDRTLQLNAIQAIRILGLLPLAMSVVGVAALSHHRLLSPMRRRGRPLVYSDASILLIALLARLLFALPIRVVRADGARPEGHPGKEVVRFIVTGVPSAPGANPIIPFNRKKQPLDRVRHLVYWPLSYLVRDTLLLRVT